MFLCEIFWKYSGLVEIREYMFVVCVQDKPVVIPGPKKEWKPSDPKDFVRFVMGKFYL